MTSSLSVQDRVIVVTGAAGQLGMQYASSLTRAGARVALLDRAAPERFPADVTEAVASGRAVVLTADVTDKSSLEGALAALVESLGSPTGLVNNAALDSPPNAPAAENGPFEDYPESSWDAVMAVNGKGTFLCCQVFGGEMARGAGGAIVNIASIYGLVSPDQRLYADRRVHGEVFYKPVAYSVSKAGVLNLTRYLATYWAEAGVRVNTLTLGGVRRDQPADFVDRYASRVPLGRMAREDEYNGAVQFLLSDASSYMTGSNLVIDGGWTAW